MEEDIEVIMAYIVMVLMVVAVIYIILADMYGWIGSPFSDFFRELGRYMESDEGRGYLWWLWFMHIFSSVG